jgi:cell division transport system permease protein
MANKRKIKRKKASYLSPILSITLVLFVTGLFGLLIFYADGLKSFLRENVQVSIIFKEDVRDADVMRLQKWLENDKAIKQSAYVDKEQALQIMKDELGEDSKEILGFNPFPASLDLYFYSEHANSDSISKFTEKIKSFSIVKEINYQKAILDNINKYVRIGALILLILLFVFLFIAIVLINNTIRLTIYSRRFLIKSMQLVGATQAFIQWPFIKKALLMGVLGGVFANFLIFIFLFALNYKFGFVFYDVLDILVFTGVLIILFGIIITVISSYYSMKKYLRTKLDDLY